MSTLSTSPAAGAAESFTVTVDYNQPLSAMIAAGKYDDVNLDITPDHFPVSGTGSVEVDIELVHFNRNVPSDQALAEMEVRGLRPATLPELLAFGAAHPEKQREFPIVALGSVQARTRYPRVPYLSDWRARRELDLVWFDDGWSDICRVAAVRK